MSRPVAEELIKIGDVAVGSKEPVFCASVGEKDPYELIDVAEEVGEDEDVDLVELRIDLLDNPMDTEVKRQIANNDIDAPLVLTTRREDEGGDFHGDERDRAKVYRDLMNFADAVDLEYHTPDRFRREVVQKSKEKNIPIIFSYHNFSRTGSIEEIKIRLEECLELGDLAKVITKPNSPKDILNLFEATLQTKKNLRKPLTCFGLGDLGKHSRIVSSFYGSDIIYGAADQAVAPGQFDIKEAKELFDSLKPTTSI